VKFSRKKFGLLSGCHLPIGVSPGGPPPPLRSDSSGTLFVEYYAEYIVSKTRFGALVRNSGSTCLVCIVC